MLASFLVVLLSAGITGVVRHGDDGDDAAAGPVVVTEADAGAVVTVAVGQRFRVELAGSPDSRWSLPRAGAASVARVRTRQAPDGSASATFLPTSPSPRVVVAAEREVDCPVDDPGCDDVTERFEVVVEVSGTVTTAR